MIIDKDISEARIIIDMVGGSSIQWQEVRDIISRIRTESAEQARKEAADRACEWLFMPYPKWINEDDAEQVGKYVHEGLRAVILNSPVKEGKTDAEELAIAAKALKSIYEMLKCDGVIHGR